MAIGLKKRNGLWSQQQQPQQRGFIANSSGSGAFGAVPGQGVSPSPVYILYKQPAQAELTGNAAPTSRQELPSASSLNPNQQYYWTQHQQQLPFVQNQTQNAAFVPAPVEIAVQPYKGVQMDAAPGVPTSGSVMKPSTQQQPQVTQVYEMSGTWDQNTYCDESTMAKTS
jgi:hypothetical protein